MPMKNPPHPGKAVRVSCLEPLGLSVTAGAKVLGITRQSLSNLINGKTGISPEMAIRLSKAFGSTPDTWIKMQAAYDLAQALKNQKQIRVERYASASGVGHPRDADLQVRRHQLVDGRVLGHNPQRQGLDFPAARRLRK